MKSPITKSCMRSVLEKQIVRRTNRLIRVRKLMCLLSIFQIPPDLVVKCKTIDIVEVIFSPIWRRNITQMSWRNRKTRFELLSPSETHWLPLNPGECENKSKVRYELVSYHTNYNRQRLRRSSVSRET